MGSETWMTIGEIALRAGLTANALRHYDRLGLLSQESVEGMSPMDEPRDDDLETTWAKELFNRVWSLLEMENRSANDDAEMIHAAHASCFHWNQVGQPVNATRGEWQCSRVYSTLGRSEPALFHAQRCLSICKEHGIGDFDLAFAYEALARANAVAGSASNSTRWAELARSACEDVKDDDDRELVLTDIETLPEPRQADQDSRRAHRRTQS